MLNYLNELQEKCNIDDNFMAIVNSIFDKLVDFGYVTKAQTKKLAKKLYDNVDNAFLDNQITLDYKTGYYDAVKKELYIKDINNLESIYLRIMYVITTTQLDDNKYSVGYSTASLSKSDYRIIHDNFGINRAVVSNLVCRLLYTIPETLSIVPTYRTYSSDFLGNEIKSDNDIYSLEGKLLNQICYTFNASEEELYNNLFSSHPQKYINKFFTKFRITDYKSLLELLDNISRMYSNYNKLCYFNSKLNENYINIKKNVLNNDVKNYMQEENKIKLAIQSTLLKLYPQIEDEDDDTNAIEVSLSEKINELEEKIISSISDLQNKLVDILIENEAKYSTIEYAIKLKTLDNLLLLPNPKLKNEVFTTITYKLLNTGERTASNLIEKIKYSLVNEIISSEKYIKIYKNLMFNKLENIGAETNTNIIALNIENQFMQLVVVNSLNLTTKKLESNTEKLQLENLGYLLNNPSARANIDKIEEIITCVRNTSFELNNARIESIYMSRYKELTFIIVTQPDGYKILKLVKKDNIYSAKLVKLSENYSVFDFNGNSSLPILYSNKTNPIKKVLSLFNIL